MQIRIRKWLSTTADDRDALRSDLFISPLTIVANLVAGIIMFAHVDGTFPKATTAGLFLVNSLYIIRGTRIFSARVRPTVLAGGQPANARATGGVANLSAHASIFYLALLVGLGGLVACAFGFAHNVYAVTLSGSLVASLGFVTVACALVSAEQADGAT